MHQLLIAIAFGLSVGKSPAVAVDDLAVVMRVHEQKLGAIEKLKPASPEKYVAASVEWAEAVAVTAERYSSMPQSNGARSAAVSQLMKTADFARRTMRDPKRAIAIYTHAGNLQSESGDRAAVAMLEQIADIYEYDLNDRAGAAKALRRLRSGTLSATPPEGDPYAAWHRWILRWLNAEIGYLETGQKFAGEPTLEDVCGFAQQLVFGAGRETTNGEPLDPDLNIYGEVSTLTTDVKAKLFALPRSHTNFLRTWIFAARLTARNEADRWLNDNDKAGFWRACLLKLTKLHGASPRDASTGIAFGVLSQTADGKPTGFALLARDSR
jgi:hypothetical protein